ncbi:MAG: NAD-dependent epimerase/dehydratase family protein, partial [Candidatus Dormibacterales bacterium]
PLPEGVRLVAEDLSTPAAAAAVRGFRAHAALHLAAQGGVSRSVRDPVGDATANVVATVSLLKACLDAGTGRVVFASSGGAVYGHAARLPTPESCPARPLSPYGAAKLACEGYLGMFDRTFGLRTVALRFGNVYGPHQDGTGEAGVVAITCHRLLSDEPPLVRGDGEQTRDFVHVADVVRAIQASLGSDVTGPFNIGAGVQATVNRVVGLLAEAAGSRAPAVRVEAPGGEVREAQLDVGRAAAELGWRPTIGFEEGMAATFESFAREVRPAVAAGRGGRFG